jgi:integrase/recombinase XerD
MTNPNNDAVTNYLEPDEVRLLINTIPEVSKHAERDTLILELLWQSGARVSEVIALLPERIGKTSVVISNLKQFHRVKNEAGKSVRVHAPDALKEVEISELLCTQLKKYCDDNKIKQGEWVFQSHSTTKCVTRWYMWSIIGRASDKARIYKFGKHDPRTGGRFKGAWPHLFRHSNAMFLLDQTQNISLVQKQLGHSKVTTTQGYAYTLKPKIKKEVAKIEW